MMSDWFRDVHHDPCAYYVSNSTPRLNETVTLRLRVPLGAPVTHIFIRSAPDGEVQMTPMRFAGEKPGAQWWEGELRISMPQTHYRFKLYTDDAAYHLNAVGIGRAEGLDHHDFKLLANHHAPAWVYNSAIYHIFVDRFFNGDPATDVSDGEWTLDTHPTRRRAWSDPPLTWEQGGSADFYGGDLPGVIQKLDYIQQVGANAVYLSPIFSAPSNHRYDTADFEQVDPHLGGNEALAALRRALDQRGMRLILDVVVNHVGERHRWFTEAQASHDAPTRDYFTFHRHPDRYETWLGVHTLPKLNYRSERLRDAMYRAPGSVLRRWLAAPYRIDGWRLDVFNMMAQQGETRLAHKVARGMRRAIKGDNPTAYFIGEHFYDATPHLQGEELDGAMNYHGFCFPLRRWLTTAFYGSERWSAGRVDPARLPGDAMMEQWRAVRAAIPYQVARGQYNLLSSHDITRFLTAVGGDKRLALLGAVLLTTYPGIPGVYYGDELGMDGGADPDNRRPMPWDESVWDHTLRARYQMLLKLRRTHPALIEGGFQELHADYGIIAYQREAYGGRIIVIAVRDSRERFTLSARRAGLANGAALQDALSGIVYVVDGGTLTFTGLEAGTAMILEGKA